MTRRVLVGPDACREWYERLGQLLGEDRRDDDDCTGCTASGCETCRQQTTRVGYLAGE